MAEYPIDEGVRSAWKLLPLRIVGPSRSACCKQATLLVQSREGGFVTQNCADCGQPDTLASVEFARLDLWLACPKCKKRMQAATVPISNYGYACEGCGVTMRLASILPRWTDL